jgi:uncharacterized phage protein (TIGR01671 family)
MLGFRVWDKDENKMDTRTFFSSNSGDVYCYWHPLEFQIYTFDNSEDYEFMQSTGLRDANGTEIYIGDIIIDDNHIDHPLYLVEDIIGFISWFHNYIRNWREGDCESYKADRYLNRITVIGNIYEQSELLEKANARI